MQKLSAVHLLLLFVGLLSSVESLLLGREACLGMHLVSISLRSFRHDRVKSRRSELLSLHGRSNAIGLLIGLHLLVGGRLPQELVWVEGLLTRRMSLSQLFLEVRIEY